MKITSGSVSESAASVYANRREKLRQSLGNLDALLVSEPANRFYLSGFELHDGQPGETSGFIIITRSGEDWLATDSRYAEAAARLWARDRIFIYSSDMAGSLCALLQRCATLIGYEARAISAAFARKLTNHINLRFLPAPHLVERLREIKEPLEITALKASFRLNHEMLDWFETRLNAGKLANLSEQELAWEIEKYFREQGAQELAFATIAATGKNGALPHAAPGADRLLPEMPLLIDVGCRVDDYCSDQTRVFWHGEHPAVNYTTALKLTREAQEAALAIMRPGARCADVYQAAKEVFAAAHVDQYFTHGLGHGVGLQTHEAPSLSPTSNQVLAEGMVVTVEPGLYYPEWGGIRWEYTVLVEKDGVQIL